MNIETMNKVDLKNLVYNPHIHYRREKIFLEGYNTAASFYFYLFCPFVEGIFKEFDDEVDNWVSFKNDMKNACIFGTSHFRTIMMSINPSEQKIFYEGYNTYLKELNSN